MKEERAAEYFIFWGQILPDFGPKCEKVRKFTKNTSFFLRMINFANTISHMHPQKAPVYAQAHTGARAHVRIRTHAHTKTRWRVTGSYK